MDLPPDLGIVLASAGSSDPAAQAQLHRLAAAWSATRGTETVCAFASAARPTVAEAAAALRERGLHRVAVATCFLAPGLLADRVAGQAREAGAAVSPARAAGRGRLRPELVRLILRRFAEGVAKLDDAQ